MNLFRGLQDYCIDSIELYRIDVAVERHFSFGTWHNRQHVFLRAVSGEYSSWAELIAGHNDPGIDIAAWGRDFTILKGCSIADAWDMVPRFRDTMPVNKCEAAEILILGLAGLVQGSSAMDILVTEGCSRVPAMYCILEEDTEKLAEACMKAQADGYSHIKIKLFGDVEKDTGLLTAARSVLSSDTFLCGDVNEGYGPDGVDDIDKLAGTLLSLHDKGLDACEDPAKLAPEEWVALQTRVDNFALIPDAPLRPSWKACETVLPGMGCFFNIHPACSGSLSAAYELIEWIRNFGGKIMIGDDSLVGPGCTIWQQFALAVGAAWVEAIEKPQESDVYQQCRKSPDFIEVKNGVVTQNYSPPGFGIELDTDKLKKLCTEYMSL
jgi:L-alanine-DL-glutamate epimerase-like enolase superfamily enzyme